MQTHETNAVNDSAIVAQLRAGGDEGVRQLLRDHGPKVMWLLKSRFGYLLPEADIEALLNDATFKVFRSIRLFDPSKGSLVGWYWRIAANTARKLLHHQMRRGRLDLKADSYWQDRAPASLAEENPALARTLKDLHEAIEQLPDLQRKIIGADLDSGDIADANCLARKYSTTVESIYVSRNKARQNLRLIMIERGYFQG